MFPFFVPDSITSRSEVTGELSLLRARRSANGDRDLVRFLLHCQLEVGRLVARVNRVDDGRVPAFLPLGRLHKYAVFPGTRSVVTEWIANPERRVLADFPGGVRLVRGRFP